jgi:hypothetical protein
LLIYSDRCRCFHREVSGLTEQEYWDFLKGVEARIRDGRYKYTETQKLYVIRTIMDEREDKFLFGNMEIWYIGRMGC